jgi:hypothetical protein
LLLGAAVERLNEAASRQLLWRAGRHS